jgi:hypothetical protein
MCFVVKTILIQLQYVLVLVARWFLLTSWLPDWLMRGVWKLVLADYCVCCADSTVLYPAWFCRCLPRCVVPVFELKASVLSLSTFSCVLYRCTVSCALYRCIHLTHVNPVCSNAQFVPYGRWFYTSLMINCVQDRNMQLLNNSIHNKCCV